MSDDVVKDDVVYTTFHNGTGWIVLPLDGMPKFDSMVDAMNGCDKVDAPFQSLEQLSKLEKKMDVLFQASGLWSPNRLRLLAQFAGFQEYADVVDDLNILATKFEELEKLK